jgi:hypothetical protein
LEAKTVKKVTTREVATAVATRIINAVATVSTFYRENSYLGVPGNSMGTMATVEIVATWLQTMMTSRKYPND